MVIIKNHDVIVISQTGQIGEVYEIQNLKIALPKQKDVFTEADTMDDSRLSESS